ncbi:hypothetical protein ABPG72_003964 [Tetrahymena utriculariae]
MKKQNRDPSITEHRHAHFDMISQNRSEFFNFFFENNDIFKLIDPEDEEYLKVMHFKYLNTTANFTFGTFGAVLLVDQVLMRFFVPHFKIKNFRFILNTTKYIGLPLIGFWVGKNYFAQDVEQSYIRMSDKYSFNYYDFNRCMDVLERAERVGRLDELLQERSNFDWTGVPEFRSKFTQKNVN